ncbi:hypothetical protein BGZ96_002406 [Linnemannia gamsii]|uniref:Uncharacterized protein n=1 Tax=Linnemannia gamsii TaxID=64522 RepID=A0ABQ7JKY3_9FUNG|nr:hypothetical protein BGZ96_002406 [Linnemannia gamsii]
MQTKWRRKTAHSSAANPSGISGSHSLLSQHTAACKTSASTAAEVSRKEYASVESTFDLYLERKRGLDAGSLKALAASDTYWNKRTCHDYEQVEQGQHVPGEPPGLSFSHGTKVVRQGIQKWKEKQAQELSASSKRPTAIKGPVKLPAQESGQSKIDNSTDSPPPSTSAPTFSTGKHKKGVCTTEEPWRSLMIALMDIVNGKNVASLPERVLGMNREHVLLFDHAVISLKQYQDQDVKDRNVVLVKDAQTVQKLEVKLIIDRGAILQRYSDQERLPASVEVEDKVLQILIIIGEKVLESSKIMRQLQSAEYGDVSESGQKVDMLSMFDGIEVSNVEFKRPGATEQDLAIQNRKNVRLARCIQEAHAALGVTDPSVLMADVAGFVGTIYQVKPLNEIAIAGEIADTTVSLPQTRATLMAFLADNSLAMMWNYVSRLEAQGQSVSEAKELHDLALEKAKLERAKRGRGQLSPDSPPFMVQKRFQDNVILTPTKKRVKILTIVEMYDPAERSPPSSPSNRDS